MFYVKAYCIRYNVLQHCVSSGQITFTSLSRILSHLLTYKSSLETKHLFWDEVMLHMFLQYRNTDMDQKANQKGIYKVVMVFC